MKKVLASMVLAFLMVGGLSQAQAACTATGFIRDGIDLTAEVINPGVLHLRNDVLGGGGCNIVVYNGPGTVLRSVDSELFGANYFGIVNNGADVVVSGGSVHDIGETPFNGTQHGVGIYCATESPNQTRNTIRGVRLWNYQKGGIVMNGSNCGDYNIVGNSLNGFGPIDFIAQNGIQGFGNSGGVIAHNMVSGHSYTGAGQASSGGILLLGGPGFGGDLVANTRVVNNKGFDNDVFLFALNCDATCSAAPATATNNLIANNYAVNYRIRNTSGNGTGPYQFGYSIELFGDRLWLDSACGAGYDPANQPSGGAIGPVDAAGSANLAMSDMECTSPAKVPPRPRSSASADNVNKGLEADKAATPRTGKRVGFKKPTVIH